MAHAQAGVPSEAIPGAGEVVLPTMRWNARTRFQQTIGQLAWGLGLRLRERVQESFVAFVVLLIDSLSSCSP